MTKTVLITGASRGIGRGILEALLAEGYEVYGTATSAAGAEGISAIVSEAGGKGKGCVLDVMDPDSITQLMKDLPNTPDILVNNAGITRDNLMMRLSDTDWQAVIDANLSGVFRLTKACVRGMMKARWGRIVSVGSVVGRMGNPGQANYAAAKAGVEGFSRALALEIGSRGITVNVVAPGYIETDMTDQLSDEVKEKAATNVALSRFGHVNEVANTVKFLVSEDASYITAATIPVNGGLFPG